MKRLLLVLITPLCFTQFVTAQSDREILRLGRGTANALDWRPDGEVLAVGSGTGIWLYDENFEPLVHIQDADTGNVTSVDWSSDGSKLALANSDHMAQVWEISDNATQAELHFAIQDAGTYIRWSPDRERLATSWTSDGHIKMWDAETGNLLLSIIDATGSVAWSSDNQMIGGNTPNNNQPEVMIWNSNTGEVLRSFRVTTINLSFAPVAWSPDGTMLAAGGSGPGGLYVWDIETGNLIVDASPLLSDILSFDQIIWSVGEDQLIVMGNAVSAPAYSNLAIWDTTTWEITAQNGFHEDGMREIALHPDGELITSVMHSSLLTLWDVGTLDFSRLVGLHNSVQNVLAWSPDSIQLASTSNYSSESSVLIWNLDDYSTTEIDQPSRMLEEGVFPWIPVTSLIWNDNHELITVSESDSLLSEFNFRSVERWNPDTGEQRSVIYATEYARGEAAWNSNFTLIAQEDYDGTHVEIRSVDTDELRLSIPMERNVVGIGWVQHDQTLSIMTWNLDTNENFVELWDSQSGEMLDEHLIVRDSTSTGRRFQSPDNRFIAVVTLDDLSLEDVSTGETLENIPIKGVNVLAWSPDSTKLSLGMNDGTIRIWDVSDLAQLAP